MNKNTYKKYGNDWSSYNLSKKLKNILEIICSGKADFFRDFGIYPNRVTLGNTVYEQLCLEVRIPSNAFNPRIKGLLVTIDNRDLNKIELEYDESLPVAGCFIKDQLSSFGSSGYARMDEDFEGFTNGTTIAYTTDASFIGVAGQCGIMGPPGINSAKQ